MCFLNRVWRYMMGPWNLFVLGPLPTNHSREIVNNISDFCSFCRCSAAVTLIACLPKCLYCVAHPTPRVFLETLFNTSLAFYLFSYHVHEVCRPIAAENVFSAEVPSVVFVFYVQTLLGRFWLVFLAVESGSYSYPPASRNRRCCQGSRLPCWYSTTRRRHLSSTFLLASGASHDMCDISVCAAVLVAPHYCHVCLLPRRLPYWFFFLK